LSTNRR